MDGVSFIFRWIAFPGCCRKCSFLNGRIWINQDVFQPVLLDSEFGPIWDLDRDVSLAHPHCKCSLDVEIIVNLEMLEIG